MSARLLLLTPDFPPNRGGIARYLFRLVEYYKDRITVVTDKEKLFNRMFWPKWLASVRTLIKMRQTYDIVIVSHVLPFGTAAYLAFWLTKKPFIVIVHGMDVRLAESKPIKKFIAGLVFKKAKVVVANSNALANEVAQIFDVMPIVVHPCLGMEEKEDTGRQGKTDDDDVRLLTVSRLVERKGHIKVLTALSELKNSGAISLFRYDIVGSGPMEQILKNISAQLNLEEVFFHAEVSDDELDSFYSKADVFVMPVSDDKIDKEGFGLVFLEAAKFGVPSISTKIEGVNEAIIDQQTGILVDPKQPHELSRAILQLVNDSELRKQLGVHAKKHAMEEFTCDKQFSKLEPYL